MYRGCAIPDLQGTYFYADYQSSRIWSLRYDGATVSQQQERTTELDPAGTLAINNPASFGEDALGELYICDYANGEIFKIVAATPVARDGNHNSRADACDIAAGSSVDENGNGVPDECERRPGDLNCDGVVNNFDIDPFVLALSDAAAYAAEYPACLRSNADCDDDGLVNNFDIDPFVTLISGG